MDPSPENNKAAWYQGPMKLAVVKSCGATFLLLLPPGWDASPSQGYPQHYVSGTHLYTWVEREECGVKFLV